MDFYVLELIWKFRSSIPIECLQVVGFEAIVTKILSLYDRISKKFGMLQPLMADYSRKCEPIWLFLGNIERELMVL